MTRKSIVLLLVGLLAVVLPASATSANGVAYCHPILGGDCSASFGDEVVIGWGWEACSKGLVKNFLKAVDVHEYTVTAPDGTTVVYSKETEEAQGIWGPILQAPPHPDCMGHMPSGAASIWEDSVGPLTTTGDYTLHFVLSLKHPVVDGMDMDGDGLPDVYSEYDITKTITVN